MRFLAAVFVLSASASTGLCQVPATTGMSGQRRAEEANRGRYPTFPSGDTAAVYRAALDLLYIDGNEKASVAVIREFVGLPRAGGPCPRCRRIAPWVHQSAIDTSTIEAFGDLSLPPGLTALKFDPGHVGRDRLFYVPNFRQFGYTIPLVLLSDDQREEIERAGAAYDSAHPRRADESTEYPFHGELSRRYPGVWGTASFSAVAFNRVHTEALLGIGQNCGTYCRSYEVVFFRKVRGRWTAIERVPGEVEARWAVGSLRYRGPIATGQSQLLVDRTGAPLPVRPDARDVPRVYRAVLDSLYSFFGERPRLMVISDRHARAAPIAATQVPQLDPNTLADYNFVSQIGDVLRFQSSFGRARPILTAERMRQVAVAGIPTGTQRVVRYDARTPGFWQSFQSHYPGAWGYVQVSRVAFNPAHTQALVFTTHHCGGGCQNSATWFLTRKGEKWSIAQQIPQQEELNVPPGSLRYLGTGANAKGHTEQRARGVVTNAATGKPLPNLGMTLTHSGGTSKITTDGQGRYSLTNLPRHEGVTLWAECPIPGRTDTLRLANFGVRPGNDTTVDVEADYRHCVNLNRDHPLIAIRSKPSRTVFHPVTAEAAAVYRAILDAIYPVGTPGNAPILMEAFSESWCRGCFGIDAEVPRLIRQGVLDASTAASFAQALRDTVSVPEFSYPRKIRLVPIEDVWLRGDRGGYNWGRMKHAYPGANAVISFSEVGFNSTGTEALVEVRVDSANKPDGGETVLLRKTGNEWRVAARHLDRGHTSGEWSGGKCEPTDAPAQPADLETVKKISGEFNITWIGTSRAIRGHTKRLRVIIEPAKPNPKYDGAVVGNVRVLGARGEPDTSIVGELWFSKDVGELIFTDQSSVRADGHLSSDNYYILRTDGTSFFGGWWYGNEEDDVDHPRGYFCASPTVKG